MHGRHSKPSSPACWGSSGCHACMQSPGGSAARDKPSAPPPTNLGNMHPTPATHTHVHIRTESARLPGPWRRGGIQSSSVHRKTARPLGKENKAPPGLLACSDGLLAPLSDALGKEGVCASVTDRGVMLDFRTFGLLAEAATPDFPRGVSLYVVASLFGIYS